MNQNEPKQSNATHNHHQQLQTIFPMSTTRQILIIALLIEEALFTWAFRRWVSLYKDLQELKVVY